MATTTTNYLNDNRKAADVTEENTEESVAAEGSEGEGSDGEEEEGDEQMEVGEGSGADESRVRIPNTNIFFLMYT